MGEKDPEQAGAAPSARAQASEHQITERLAAVDGINGAAGLHLDDEALRELLRRRIAGEITSEEYRRLGAEHLNTLGGS